MKLFYALFQSFKDYIALEEIKLNGVKWRFQEAENHSGFNQIQGQCRQL